MAFSKPNRGGDGDSSRSVKPLVSLVVSRGRDRVALVLIALSAGLSSAIEAIVLVIVTLAGFRLSATGQDPIDLPFGLPLDEISTGRLLGIGGVLLVLRLGVVWANLSWTARLSTSVLSRWRRRIVGAFLATSWETQQSEQEGHLQTVAQLYVGNLSNVVQQLSASLTAMTSFFTFVIGAFVLSPFASLGLLVFGAVLSVVLKPLTMKLRRLAGKDKSEGQEYVRQLNEIASASTEVRVFGREVAFQQRLDVRLTAQLASRKKSIVVQGVTPQLFQVAGLGTVLIGLAVASTLALDDAVIVGALILLLVRSLSYGRAFQGTYQAIASSRPFVDGVIDALDRYERAALPSGDVDAVRLGSLTFEGASLGYGDDVVVRSVDLQIGAGEAIGIIGPSGAGKSTLGAAFLDLLRPSEGTYRADQTLVSDISRSTWTQLVAFVPQEPKLFEGSVRQNIDFYRDRPEDEVHASAIDAHLGRELEEWPEGLDREVGPRGGHLSGGQKQRICIARALLGKPEVLIMDEPTSALDNDAEDSITDVLRELRGKATLIVIAHRLSTLEFCDRVLLVDKGSVVEIGTGADVQDRAEVRRLAEAALNSGRIR